MDRLGGVFGRLCALLGPSKAVLGRSMGPLGPSCSDLLGLYSRLGASGKRKRRIAKNIEKPDIATNPDLEMQVGMIGESGRGKEEGPVGGLIRRRGKRPTKKAV